MASPRRPGPRLDSGRPRAAGRGRRGLALLLSVGLGLPAGLAEARARRPESPAVGAAATEGERALARRRYERGEALFAAGRYQEAIVEYRAGYELARLPGFLINVAHCHARLGAWSESRAAYREFLRLAPTSPRRAEVERALAAIEARLDAPAPRRAAEPPRRGAEAPIATVAPPAGAAAPPAAAPSAAAPPGAAPPTAPPPAAGSPPVLGFLLVQPVSVAQAPPLPAAGAVPPPALVGAPPAPARPAPTWLWPALAGAAAAVGAGVTVLYLGTRSSDVRSGTLGSLSR